MSKNKRNYVPAEAQLSYSGVTKEELPELKKFLKSVGAKEIEVRDDDGDYSEFDNGKYYVVSYKR
jgi:hypothetical protein